MTSTIFLKKINHSANFLQHEVMSSHMCVCSHRRTFLFHLNYQIFHYFYFVSRLSGCRDSFCTQLFSLLNNPLLYKVFFLLCLTDGQIFDSCHVRIHTNRLKGKEEKEDAKYRSQFVQKFCKPKDTRDVIRECTNSYHSGSTLLVQNTILYHTVSGKEVYDFWDFKFFQTKYSRISTETTDFVIIPTRDTYTQCQSKTVYRQDKFSTTSPVGLLYNTAGNFYGDYRGVYDRDYFKFIYPKYWKKMYDRYKKKQR